MLCAMHMRMIVMRLDFEQVCRSLYMNYQPEKMDSDESSMYDRLSALFVFGKCSLFCENQPMIILWRMNNSGTIDEALSCKRCYSALKLYETNSYIRPEVTRKCVIMKSAQLPARDLNENSLISVNGMYKVRFFFNIVSVAEY